ncbi:MAG: twin-arginine translocase subunit TatB [Gammaproteobacteria bacterium]|nr:twin-arginine translocase subunit TatB [Gammaproteobacteria bacterium]
MFDIGFGEIVVVCIVALLVVGPDEFPQLVATVGRWLGKVRRFLSDTKADFDREVQRIDELKRKVDQELEIAEAHRNLDPNQPTVPVARRSLPQAPAAPIPPTDSDTTAAAVDASDADAAERSGARVKQSS